MPKFDLGTVFSRFFKLVGENAGLFFAIGVIGNIVPAVAVTYAMFATLGLSFQGKADFSQFTPDNFGYFGGAGLIIFIMSLVTLSMITEVAILRAVGKTPNLATVLGHGFRNILPIIAISILIFLLLVAGMVLLIVPLFFWAICTCVAVPCYVGEPGRGIFGSISRSFELTKGNRWWLLLIFFVAIVAETIGSSALGAAIPMLAQPGNEAMLMPLQLLNAVFSGVLSLLGNIFITAIYVCLRESKEKLSPENAASVFS